jgi:hypothetical protein
MPLIQAEAALTGSRFDGPTPQTPPQDTVNDREQAARGATSPALANGRWYFHLRTRDNVGN